MDMDGPAKEGMSRQDQAPSAGSMRGQDQRDHGRPTLWRVGSADRVLQQPGQGRGGVSNGVGGSPSGPLLSFCLTRFFRISVGVSWRNDAEGKAAAFDWVGEEGVAVSGVLGLL